MLRRNRTPFEPVMLVERHLGHPERIDPAPGPDGAPYKKARVLVLGDRGPVGTVYLDLPPDGVDVDEVERAMKSAVGGSRAKVPTVGLPVTVVIATRDRPEQLERCLASLDQQSLDQFDVIVVDNAPSGEPVDRLLAGRTVKGKAVRYVFEPRRGLAHAHNAALPLVETPIVAFTDDDVETHGRWLESLVEAFAEFPQAACVTGLIYPARLDYPAEALVEDLGFGKAYRRRVFDLDANRPDERLYPFAVGLCGSGANMAFRTEILRRLDGFDPALGTGSPGGGGDDLAAFFDVIDGGHAIVYEPAAMVRHHHDPSPERLRHQVYQYGVGLGAYLTRCVVRKPTRLGTMLLQAPLGLRHLMSSDQNGAGTLPLLPRIRGFAAGPMAYRRGRRAAREA